MNSDWKKDMDKLYKLTLKNWKTTGNETKAAGVSGSISLGSPKNVRR